MNFWILPVEVFGIGPNTTAFGVLKPDIWPRQNAMISASVARALSFNSMNAQGTSPHFASGFATARHRLHGFGIEHRDTFLQRVGHPLPALKLGALIGG